jgi:predicted DNA-binding transcriptional regulator YafY
MSGLNYNAPIAYCKRNGGFYYTDPDYSIQRLPLSEREIEKFDLLVESFQGFKGAQVLNEVEGMFDKLSKVAGQLKQKKSKLPYKPILFERIPYVKGMEHFDELYDAILEQRPMVIRYKKFDYGKPKDHTFHPYLLKEYKFRWYLLGYSERSKSKLILALDRMDNLTPIKIPFLPYKGIDIQKYFDHAIGVTINPAPAKDIRLWFSPLQGNYIKTQPLHATQKPVSDDASGLIVSLKLIPNYELLQTLLAFGPEVKVLEPISLQEQMKEMVKKTMTLYEP